jgi:gamma-glutamylcyclotransferase (GGCT)/AIG2-like uncharacterized protein YtfP
VDDDGALPIFVYGTLQPGDVGFAELAIETRVQCLGPAFVRGILHDLGDYPGIVLAGSGLVRGQLIQPLDMDVLPLLDKYELYDPYDPKESEFLRLRTLAGPRLLSCWIYVYNWTVTDSPVIPGGDWSRRSGT